MTRLKSIAALIALTIFAITSIVIASPYEDSRAVAVSGGEDHTLVLTADANLWACGDNGHYQLGIGDTTTDQKLLVRVHGVNDVNLLENIIGADSGWKHSLAIDVNNNVLAWGRNAQGQLGVGEGVSYSSTPILVHDGEMVTDSNYLEHIIAVSAGRSGEHSLALDNSNHVWSFGRNDYGQLGDGTTTTPRTTPVAVHAGQQNPANPNAALFDIVQISAGEMMSVALEKIDANDPNYNGRVLTWGSNKWPIEASYPSGKGKLGNGDITADSCDLPVLVLRGAQPGDSQYLERIIAVSTGWDHTMALEELDLFEPNCLGRVYTFGNNGQGYGNDENPYSVGGRLGDGTYNDANVPVMVVAGQQNPAEPTSPLKNIVAISAGEGHSMALDDEGNVFCWGDNYFGQLGNGTTDPCTTPVQVIAADTNQPLSGIVAISAAYWHNLAIDVNGTIWTWGKSADGRLGLGSAIKAEISTTAHPINLVLNRSKGNYYFGIQTAIDDANNGNIIEAQPGTYYEDVDFKTRTITLTSVNPENSDVVEGTVIYGSSDAWIPSVKFYNNSGSVLTGFTVTGTDDGIVCTSSSPQITKCVITNNDYRGIYCSNSDTNITDCIINNNGDHGIQSSTTEISVHNCIITKNDSNGICTKNSSSRAVTITNNIVSHNADHGIYCYAYNYAGNVNVATKNNWIYANGTDGTGDGIYIELAYPNPAVIRNNTIADNNDYGIRADSSNYTAISNCILWDNGLGQLNNCSATYSCIDIDPVIGQGNINSDPCFAHADANNFHIGPNSLCIDVGNTALITDPNELDIDGEDRIVNGGYSDDVDMGADELYWPKADYDKSEIVNFIDFAYFANAWHDSNDTIDLDGDNFVDINDLILFCSDWLWVAPWSAQYEQMMSQTPWGMTASGSPGLTMDTQTAIAATTQAPGFMPGVHPTAPAQSEPLSAERIEELIDWTEQLLETDDELKELVGESQIRMILDSLKGEL